MILNKDDENNKKAIEMNKKRENEPMKTQQQERPTEDEFNNICI